MFEKCLMQESRWRKAGLCLVRASVGHLLRTPCTPPWAFMTEAKQDRSDIKSLIIWQKVLLAESLSSQLFKKENKTKTLALFPDQLFSWEGRLRWAKISTLPSPKVPWHSVLLLSASFFSHSSWASSFATEDKFVPETIRCSLLLCQQLFV